MANSYKPGEKADRSGQYEIVGPRGGRTGIERTGVVPCKCSRKIPKNLLN